MVLAAPALAFCLAACEGSPDTVRVRPLPAGTIPPTRIIPRSDTSGAPRLMLGDIFNSVTAPTPTPPPPPTPAPVRAVQVQAASQGASAASVARPVYIEECGRSYPDNVARWWAPVLVYRWNPCEALNVIKCESGGSESIWNTQCDAEDRATGHCACGLMQHLPCQAQGDGYASIALGVQKWESRGWQPWQIGGCSPY